MVPSITAILQRFTGEWAALLQPDAILAGCSEIGYTGWRDRVLTPVSTVQLFLLQILHGNTACSHLPHLSGLRFSAAAYCQARAQLPLHLFVRLPERFSSAVQPSALDGGRWHGHRAFLVDGSGCSMPDTPALQEAFGQSTGQRPGCGVPVARLLGLFHAGTGVLLRLVVAPLLTHDLALVMWFKPKPRPSWLARETSAALPEALVLREVRYRIGTPGFRPHEIILVTTLLDAKVYRVADLAELYRRRWQVETSLAHLKTTMQMDVLRCKTVPGVLKELTIFALVYNLVRMVMGQSAGLQHIRVERISFVDALRWLSAPSAGMP